MRYITKREKVKLAEDLGIAVPNSFRKEAMAESAPASPQSAQLGVCDQTTGKVPHPRIASGAGACINWRPIQSDQPERSAIDEANSILYPNRTPSSGADAREWAANWLNEYHEYDVDIKPLATLLESFRAETLARMLELLNSHRLLSGKPGDECSCGKWNANYPDRDRDVWQAWLQHIRALSPDPTWLARQIVEAKIQEWTQAPFHAWPNVGDDPQHPYPAEWVRGILEHRNRRLVALESASAKLGDKGEAR